MQAKTYRFQFSPTKKIDCPVCEHKKCFRLFMDVQTGELLEDKFGRCDRENNCGYFLYPGSEEVAPFKPMAIEEKPLSFVDAALIEQTFKHYHVNNLHLWLITRFGETVTRIMTKLFCIGTAKNGYTIFWYKDKAGNFRTGKKMLYKPMDGKRNRESMPVFLFTSEDGYEPCLFGEHQISNSKKIIALVESEKTAIINTIYEPSFTWLACGGANGLTQKKAMALKGREVLLFCDYDKAGRQAFYSKLDFLNTIGCHAEIADPYPEITDGSDLADIYLKENLEFQNDQLINNGYPVLWDLPL